MIISTLNGHPQSLKHQKNTQKTSKEKEKEKK